MLKQNRKKIVITLIAVGVALLAVAGVLIITQVTNPNGTVRVTAGNVTVEPVGELVMRMYQDGRIDDRWATEIEDLYPSMPVIVYDGNKPKPVITGKLESYEPLYVVYHLDGEDWVELLQGDDVDDMMIPTNPGIYVVKLDVCWGDYTNFSQFWFYYILEVPA